MSSHVLRLPGASATHTLMLPAVDEPLVRSQVATGREGLERLLAPVGVLRRQAQEPRARFLISLPE